MSIRFDSVRAVELLLLLDPLDYQLGRAVGYENELSRRLGALDASIVVRPGRGEPRLGPEESERFTGAELLDLCIVVFATVDLFQQIVVVLLAHRQ